MKKPLLVVAAALLAIVGLPRPVWPSDEASADSLTAQQIVHLLEYVAADYGGAVSGGQVVNERELAEQLEVIAEAGRLSARLRSVRGDVAWESAVQELHRLVEAHRSEADVSAAAKALVEQISARFDLPSAPRHPPSQEHGRELYGQHCSGCHGVDGRADTARAAQYTPRPVNFHAPEVARALSPLRISRVARFGVPNTAMVPFDFLSDDDRWDVAFFVSELDHDAAPRNAREAHMFGLSDLASETDDELRSDLRNVGLVEQELEGALSYLRTKAPYDPDFLQTHGNGAMVLRARAGLHKVGKLVTRRDPGAAAALLGVYLDDVEPIEAPLRAADPALLRDIEAAFNEVRADIDHGGKASEIAVKLDALGQKLAKAGLALQNETGSSFATIAISSAGIALREGVEAALLIAALLAVVGKAGAPERKRFVHAGWIAAAFAAVITWFLSRRVVEMSGMRRETLEGVAALLAALILFYVSYWLFAKREAARWVTFLRTKATGGDAALSLFGISFLAVYREGFETVIFYQALIAEPGKGPAAAAGAIVGLLCLVLLVALYGRAGKFAPPRSFFGFSSVLLYALAIVFAGQGLAGLQTTGYAPLHPVRLPHLPALGIYPTVETYAVQLILLALAILAFVLLRAHRTPPPGSARAPLAGSREGAKLIR